MKVWGLALALSLFGLSATAQDKTVELKISIWLPPGHPLVPATREWAGSIERQSAGTIKSVVLASEQLGKAVDYYDMARDGVADIAFANPGYQIGRFPVIAAGRVPFTFADGNKGTAALDDWYRRYGAPEMKDTHFCLAFIHDPGTYHGRKRVAVPDDIKGMKICPAGSELAQMMTLLGGINIQQGDADALFFPWGSMSLLGLDKVLKYHIDAPVYSTAFVYTMNKMKYDGMSAAQKKVIDLHCTTEWAVKPSSSWQAFEASGRNKTKAAAGQEVYALSPDQLRAWRASAVPVQRAWADTVTKSGGNADALYREFQFSIARYGAGF